MRVAIIGGGAAGLFAANLLFKKRIDYFVFERESRVGKKLLATGNGRCNLSNLNVTRSRYHGDKDFATEVISAFSPEKLENILKSLGILIKFEGEKMFPYSLQASSVLDMLRLGLQNVKTDCEVLSLTEQKNGFLVKTREGSEFFDKVIVCTGGRAAKKLSGGGSYELLTDLGYSLTPLKPAIVQLKCDGTKALEGIKINAKISLDEKTETGELLFTSYGLSGPPILQLSRDAKGKTIVVDALSEMSFIEAFEALKERKNIAGLTLENLFTGIINKKLGAQIIKRSVSLPLSTEVKALRDSELKSIVNQAKNLSFEILDTNGFENAQVTAGGIDPRDFSPKTMRSKKHKNLYALGEMLNVDGDCGGFNLHFAFAGAYLAVKSIAEE